MLSPSIGRGAAALVSLLLCAALLPQAGMAQKQDHEERKVLSKVAPVYPDLAKRMHVGGVVRVEVVVGPKGAVKSRVLGGNPVLIESDSDAVRKWKFETASAHTTEVLQVTFEAH